MTGVSNCFHDSGNDFGMFCIKSKKSMFAWDPEGTQISLRFHFAVKRYFGVR